MTTLPGVDVASYQGTPGQWQANAGKIAWAAVKITELQPGGREYFDSYAPADWSFLKARKMGRIAYLFGHPSTSAAATAAFFAAKIRPLGLDDKDGIALDLEVTDGRTPAEVEAWSVAVMSALELELHRVPILYSYRDFILAGNCTRLGSYPLWLSDPSDAPGSARVPEPWKSCAIQQVKISGNIDRDVAYFASLEAMAVVIGKTGANKPPTPTPPPPPPAPSSVPAWQETAVKSLPVVKPGAKGEVVRTVQGLCVARGRALKVDGSFGSITETAVRDVQVAAKFTGKEVDGIVGPKTWPVLLGI